MCFKKKLSTKKAAISVIEVLLTSELICHQVAAWSTKIKSERNVPYVNNNYQLLIVLVECTWKIFQPGCAASGEINRVEFGHLTLKANECSCRLLSVFQNRSWNCSESWFYSKLDFGSCLDPSLPFQDLQECLNTKPNRLIWWWHFLISFEILVSLTILDKKAWSLTVCLCCLQIGWKAGSICWKGRSFSTITFLVY